jgi:hypothetical protein
VSPIVPEKFESTTRNRPRCNSTIGTPVCSSPSNETKSLPALLSISRGKLPQCPERRAGKWREIEVTGIAKTKNACTVEAEYIVMAGSKREDLTADEKEHMKTLKSNEEVVILLESQPGGE